jgi:N-acyl-D-amino-acid deacylase
MIRMMAHPMVFCGSDTSDQNKLYDPECPSSGHPRSMGTMVRRLELVRDFRLRTMEESVKNLTRDTAQALGLGQRGLLQEGWPADITVLDYDRCHAAADYVHPRRRSTGIHWVLVNGVMAVEHGVSIPGVRAGKLLKRTR